MFATVECKDAGDGIRTFFRDLFALPEIIFERQSVPYGDDFYRVTATEYRGQIPLEAITEKLNKLKGSVLFDINIPTDENTRCLEFHPERLPQLLLFNSFTDYISSLGLPAVKSSLTVFDNEGIYPDMIHKAVELFSKIEIYTGKPDLYSQVSSGLLDSFGISLVVRNRFSGRVPKSTVILSPDDAPFADFFSGILFTLSDNSPPCSCVMKGEGIDLPPVYDMLRPKGIASLSFASALYERCNVWGLGELSCKKLRMV